jgi:HEAT repeat protein
MAISFRMTVGVMLILGTIAGLLSAQPAKPGPAAAKPERKLGRFSKPGMNLPMELRFGDFGFSSDDENEYKKALAEGDTHEKLAAARVLWEGHSRRQASNVLKFLADPPPGGDDFRKLQRDVESSLQPKAVLHELKEGDYLWGCWLAFLRPHNDYVPALLTGLKDHPDMLAETALALGNSGDPRAKDPLVELLRSKDDEFASIAARALGYLGIAEAELIEALTRKNNWIKANACCALEQTGSSKAIPALEKLAKDDRPTGAVALQYAAQTAIESIKKREKK